MKVVVAAGGTGGHLYPALALVEYIKKQEPDSQFLFIGTKDRLESQVVPQLGYDYVGLNVKGLVGNPLKKVHAALLFVCSIGHAKKTIKKFNPDIVVGFGGYPSASAVQAAFGLKIKTMIHEQNSIIGLTNKILIKKVDQIVMGSLGSQTVNQTMKECMDQFKGKDYQVVYVSGKPYYESMKAYENENVHIVPYVNDMPSLMHITDLIVSRAGASTLAELTALGVPAILIPSPYVSANHQEYNARELVNNQAADMILEKDLTGEKLISTIDAIINDESRLNVLKENAQKLGKPNALEDMYRVIVDMLGK